MRRAGSLVAVVHRSHETWTHLYRIESGARSVVHLERAVAGEALEPIRQWAIERYDLGDEQFVEDFVQGSVLRRAA